MLRTPTFLNLIFERTQKPRTFKPFRLFSWLVHKMPRFCSYNYIFATKLDFCSAIVLKIAVIHLNHGVLSVFIYYFHAFSNNFFRICLRQLLPEQLLLQLQSYQPLGCYLHRSDPSFLHEQVQMKNLRTEHLNAYVP